MKSIVLIISSALLFSCVEENNLNAVFPSHLLNANSSKVWVLNKSSDSNTPIPEMKAYRSCFLFYENRNFREQELIHLGSNQGAVGQYSIAEDKNGNYLLTLKYHKGKPKPVHFIISELATTRMVLKKKKEDNQFDSFEFNTLAPPLKN